MKGSTGGEIVQVQGGHIVRATGRKDRHSKVYTAKGPRDRRVRLSAHTAIQFYDVQDRLGYDRPSKAVDWLIKKAKTAIDKLAELPPWHPFDTNMEEANQNANAAAGSTAEMVIADQSESSGYSSFMAPSLDHDAIPDTMKSLFPISSSTVSSMNFQSYATRAENANQDLGLSLHPFQDQDFTMNWNNNNTSTADDRGSGLINRGFNLHPPPLPLPLMSNQDTDFSHHQHHQRGTLQSSFANSFRVWNDLAMVNNSSVDHHHQSHRTQDVHRQWFAPEGLSGFGIPARIHGNEEQSPSSSSPHSQH